MKSKSAKSFGVRRSDMATRETKPEWSKRRVNKLFDNVAKPKINVAKTPPKQAVKLPGKMGPARPKPATARAKTIPTPKQYQAAEEKGVKQRFDPKVRKDDEATRGKKMRAHFKQILSGRAGRMQGNK